MFNKPTSEAGLLNKGSSLAAALGVIKGIVVSPKNMATLYCLAQVRHSCSTNSPQSLIQNTSFRS